MNSNNMRNKSAEKNGFLWAACRGSIIGALTSFVAVLVLSGAALLMEDPKKLITAFAYGALLVGAFVGGFSSAKLDKDRSAVSAFMGGVGYVLLLWLVSLAFRANAMYPVTPIFMILAYIGCTAVSFIGGLAVRGKRGGVKFSRKNPTTLVRGQLGRR